MKALSIQSKTTQKKKRKKRETIEIKITPKTCNNLSSMFLHSRRPGLQCRHGPPVSAAALRTVTAVSIHLKTCKQNRGFSYYFTVIFTRKNMLTFFNNLHDCFVIILFRLLHNLVSLYNVWQNC